MKKCINVLQLGLGPIGISISKLLSTRSKANIVAAIDIDPKLKHTSLGQLIDNPSMTTPVSDNLQASIDENNIDIAVVTTSSKASTVALQIQPLLKAGISVVTTCEELSYPWHSHADTAQSLDQLAKAHNCSILATGVNPGFLMDYLPSSITALSAHVDSIIVNRVQNASHRRLPFQKKIGAGLNKNDFIHQVEEGHLRHVGLTESVYFIAYKMGWTLTEVSESLEPVMHNKIAQGVQQQATGYIGKNKKIELNFIANINQPQPEDRIIITGSPSFTLTFNPPINGDTATASITVNAIPSLLKSTHGLKTMGDIPSVTAW